MVGEYGSYKIRACLSGSVLPESPLAALASCPHNSCSCSPGVYSGEYFMSLGLCVLQRSFHEVGCGEPTKVVGGVASCAGGRRGWHCQGLGCSLCSKVGRGSFRSPAKPVLEILRGSCRNNAPYCSRVCQGQCPQLQACYACSPTSGISGLFYPTKGSPDMHHRLSFCVLFVVVYWFTSSHCLPSSFSLLLCLSLSLTDSNEVFTKEAVQKSENDGEY